MLKKLSHSAVQVWRDEMKMLSLAIGFGLPIALLVLMNFGLFFIFMARHTELVMLVGGVEIICLLRAGFLRLTKTA